MNKNIVLRFNLNRKVYIKGSIKLFNQRNIIIYNEMLNNIFNSYYLMDNVTKYSKIMGLCYKTILKYTINYRWKY